MTSLQHRYNQRMKKRKPKSDWNWYAPIVIKRRIPQCFKKAIPVLQKNLDGEVIAKYHSLHHAAAVVAGDSNRACNIRQALVKKRMAYGFWWEYVV